MSENYGPMNIGDNYGMMNIGGGINSVGRDLNTGYKPRVTTSEQELLKSVREHVAADPAEREHDIFLSHATADCALARKLRHALEELGADVWIDESNLGLGQNIARAIDRGISRSRIGVVLVTPTVIKGRPWVERERERVLGAARWQGDGHPDPVQGHLGAAAGIQSAAAPPEGSKH